MSRNLVLDLSRAPGLGPGGNGSAAPPPGPERPAWRRLPRPVRRVPVIPLALYYAAVAATWGAVGAAFPAIAGRGAAAARLPSELAAVVAMAGALALMAPVVSVYMLTRRLRYDPSLVHSLVILPVVTAGIFLVVENSLARAFSLAGIVAAVRFRNTLRETRDIVYILLALGIGLAAGAEALDVAVVMSAAFNVLVLVLWSFNVGSMYSAGSARRGILSVGEPRLLLLTTPGGRAALRRRMLEVADGFEPDGLLLVHTPAVEEARYVAEEVLTEGTRDWRRAGRLPGRRGMETLAYLVRLKKRQMRPAELLANLDECSLQVRAAEYLPLDASHTEPPASAGRRRAHAHGRNGRHDAGDAAALEGG